jgi:2-amino-4-hydroxy-6-hydroxymethyldihydropteridine diphosphokinase
MGICYLLTGSNIGDSQAHLLEALKHIEEQIGEVLAVSSVYKTEPWGNKNQQDFLNQVLEVHSSLHPEVVLDRILAIEQLMGRNREVKWEPRVIDIDILFARDQQIQTPELQIPHPLLHERRFTLLPLSEIAPELVHPVFHKSILELLADCPDTGLVVKLT